MEALAWADGATLFQLPLGPGAFFNPNYAAVQVLARTRAISFAPLAACARCVRFLRPSPLSVFFFLR
jgi:hypothetical protein